MESKLSATAGAVSESEMSATAGLSFSLSADSGPGPRADIGKTAVSPAPVNRDDLPPLQVVPVTGGDPSCRQAQSQMETHASSSSATAVLGSNVGQGTQPRVAGAQILPTAVAPLGRPNSELLPHNFAPHNYAPANFAVQNYQQLQSHFATQPVQVVAQQNFPGFAQHFPVQSFNQQQNMLQHNFQQQNMQQHNFQQQNQQQQNFLQYYNGQNLPQPLSFAQQNFPQNSTAQNFPQQTAASASHTEAHSQPLSPAPFDQARATKHAARRSALGAPNHEELEDQGESDSSQGDEQEEGEESDEEDAQGKPTKCSFADQVRLLQTILPNAVGASTSTKTIRTEADLVFGGEEEEKEDLILLESGAIRSELQKVQAFARNHTTGESVLNIGPKEVPDFPRALACGKFLKLRQPPFPRTAAFKHDAIPKNRLSLTSEDLLLSKGKTHQTINLSDKTVGDWEEAARRGLESLSIMDSFFGATLKSIFSKSKGGVEVNQNINPKQVEILKNQVSENLKFSMHVMATLHTNMVMARREGVLANSDVNTDKKASLRALPPGKSLFDEHVHSVIKSQAELMRDLACQSSKRQAPSKAAHGPTHTPAKKAAYQKPYKGKGGRTGGSAGGKFKPQNKPKSSSNNNKQQNL